MFVSKLEFKLGPGRIFGLDISHKTAAVTVIYPDCVIHQYEIYLTEEGLGQFLRTLRPEDCVVMEATGNTWYLYERIKPLVREVAVADPKKVKLIVSSNAKTDRNDSYILAILKAMGFLPTVWMPDTQTQGDRELLHTRQALLGDQTRVKNRVRALLAQHGMAMEATDLNGKDAELFLVQATARFPEATRLSLASYLRELDFSQGELRRLDAQVLVRAQRWQPELDRLRTIPGVGMFLAFAILAVVGTVDRFEAPASLGNYTGAVPRLRASAGKSWSGGITKDGPSLLRWALTEAVYGLIRSDGHFRNLYQRIKRRHSDGHGIAVMACVRELAEVVWKMLKTQRSFQECVPQPKAPSTNQVERRQKLQHRKDVRESRCLTAAKQEAAKQPPALEVLRHHLEEVMTLARVSDKTRSTSRPMNRANQAQTRFPARVSMNT